ncbi:MAG: methyltransferase, TIGR04325 family [Desulfamplus sp.]|nr:methyltransferase, TIGR04325 family [Desulfamplus sp.]
MSVTIWEGIYSSFQEAPSIGNGFHGEVWINKSLEKITTIKKEFCEKGYSLLGGRNAVLPVVVSILYAKKNKIKILDVGGGIGFDYYAVSNSLSSKQGFEFHILDIEEICLAGSHFFKEESNIKFHSTLPEDINDFDVIHLGSSLQYIEKWQYFLRKLCDLNPECIVFTDLLAGNFSTFVSTQNYYTSKISVYFFNIGEIISLLNEKSYKLIYKSNYLATIRGVEQKLPLENFPKELRLNHALNCIFIKYC